MQLIVFLSFNVILFFLQVEWNVYCHKCQKII